VRRWCGHTFGVTPGGITLVLTLMLSQLCVSQVLCAWHYQLPLPHSADHACEVDVSPAFCGADV
jgi:hypothetical protein